MYKGSDDVSGDDCNPYTAENKNVLDTWILAKLDELETIVTKGLNSYNVFITIARALAGVQYGNYDESSYANSVSVESRSAGLFHFFFAYFYSIFDWFFGFVSN
jgi:hypothetical protein